MLSSGFIPSEFYEMKIKNLTDDNVKLQGENTALRKHIREAEEYRIRYELLITSSENEIKQLKINHENILRTQKDEVISSAFKEKEQKWRREINELEEKLKEEAQLVINNLKKENSDLKEKVQGYEKRNQEMELYAFKLKRYEQENEGLKEKLEQLKQSKEKQKEEELASLRNHLTSSFREKMANARNAFDIKLAELQQKLNDAQTQKDNEEIQMPKLKTKSKEEMNNLVYEKHEKYEEELNNLSRALQNKNEEIKLLLEQRLNQENAHRQQINEKRSQIDDLENIIIEKEKKHQTELHNVIQRTNATKELQIEQLSKETEEIKEMLERERSIWQEKVFNNNTQIEELKRRFEDEKKKLLDEKNFHKRRLSDLSIKLKKAEGERELGQTQMLINSIRDLDGREDQLGGYQNGIVFMQRQLKKCQIKLEEKSSLINKLYKDINQIRGEMDQQLQEQKEKFKKEKKELTKTILNLEVQNKSLFDQIRGKERDQRKRERQTFKEKTELEEKNQALSELVEELQRDYKRVIEAKKGAESSYRSERQKNLTHSTDNSALKKQKWLQLEKQKNQLQIIFRDKEQQLKLSTQMEIDQKNNIIDKLRMELEVTKNENELLKTENQRFLGQIESNKENNRLADYHKKISSLNLEIALTQNIYQSLIKAKMNVPHENMTESIVVVDVRHEEEHKDEDPADLTMSFFPENLKQKKK